MAPGRLVNPNTTILIFQHLNLEDFFEFPRNVNVGISTFTERPNFWLKPRMYILDNKWLDEFKKAIKTNNMEYQLVPPHDHRRNIAEKTVQTCVAVLCWTDNKFPMQKAGYYVK